jgi:hypothetical protein
MRRPIRTSPRTTTTFAFHIIEVAARSNDTETAVLGFERSWWKLAGAKESAIHDTYGWSPTRHYLILNTADRRPEALAYDPMLVRRLQRLRDSDRRPGALGVCPGEACARRAPAACGRRSR